MEKTSNPVSMLLCLRGSSESRSLHLATLTEAVQLWRQTRSLAAYHVIVAALDSNNDEVRQLAEASVNRSSPRPASHGLESDSAASGKSRWWKESA